MEVSDVRRRVLETIERARRELAERRVLIDEASRDYAKFLDGVAVPLLRQMAGVLKAQGYPFTVSTPGGSVRLSSDKSPEDFIELALDTTGPHPLVVSRTRSARGRRVLESERPVSNGPVHSITEEQLLAFLLKELEALVA
jgi:hypothetical protein